MTYGGKELYSSTIKKIAVVIHSLIRNHKFVDGNKRIGIAVMVILAKNKQYKTLLYSKRAN